MATKPKADTLSQDKSDDDIIDGADPTPEAQARAKKNLEAVGGKLTDNDSVSAYGNVITKN